MGIGALCARFSWLSKWAITLALMLTHLIDFEYDVQQTIDALRCLLGGIWGMESRDL